MISPTSTELSGSPTSPTAGPGAQSTSIQVVVRLRPITHNDRNKPGRDSSEVAVNASMTSNTVILPSLSNRFFFDYVFDDTINQNQVYVKSVLGMISSFLEGFNITILAYGQTSSGKTHTMGTSGMTNSEADGIIPRAVNTIFETIDAVSTPDNEISVYISYLELYNEDLIDLLVDAGPSDTRPPIIIREDKGKIIWTGIREVQVTSPEDVSQLLQIGSTRRQTASTDMNSVSSRSHAIFSVNLVQYRIGKNNTKSIVRSKCHFVDLAGSERLKRTGASGDRAKEGININSGLLALGNVISALGDASKRNTHIPYRDSKLTRLLQDSIGGNSYTMMIACVSPVKADVNETYNTLKYANRARNIKNKISKDQEDITDIPTLKAIIQELNEELDRYRSGTTGGPSPTISPSLSPTPPTPAPNGNPATSMPMYYLVKRAQVLEKDLLTMKRKYAMLQAKFVAPRPASSLSKVESPSRSTFSDNASIVFSETSNTSDFHKLIEPVVEEYEQTLKTVERDLTQSREDNISLETELNHLRSKVSALESTYSSQTKTTLSLREQMEELLEENIHLRETIEARDLNGKDVEGHSDLENNTNSKSSDVKELNELRMLKLEEENRALVDQIKNLNSSTASAEQSDWESKCKELELKVTKLESGNSNREFIPLSKQSTPSHRARSLNDDDTILGADSRLEMNLRELEELESAAAKMQVNIRSSSSNNQDAQSFIDSPYSERLDILENELQIKMEQLADLESQINAKNSQPDSSELIASLKAKETELQSTIQDHQKRIDSLLISEAAHLTTTQELQDKIRTLEADLLKSQSSIIDSNTKEVTENPDLDAQLKELEELNLELNSQLKDSQQEVEAYTALDSASKASGVILEAKIEEQQAEIARLNASLEETNNLLIKANQSVEDHEVERNTLTREHDSASSTIDSKLETLRRDHDELLQKESSLLEEIESQESVVEALKKDISERDFQIEKLKSEVNSYTEKVQSLEESLNSAREELREQHDLVGLQMEKTSSEKTEVLRLKELITDLEKQISDAQSKPEPSNTSEKELTAIREQSKQLNEKLESTRRELTVSNELVDALETELQKLETSHKESQETTRSNELRYSETVKRLEADRLVLTERLTTMTKEYENAMDRNTRYAHQARLSNSQKDDEGTSQSSGSRRSKSKFICI